MAFMVGNGDDNDDDNDNANYDYHDDVTVAFTNFTFSLNRPHWTDSVIESTCPSVCLF